MNQQRFWVAFIAVGMCVHALIVGRQLESIFGIAAFAWGWITWTAIFNRLADAQTMAFTMTAILIASSVALVVASNDTSTVIAYLSLALVPAIVAFVCVSYLIWDLQRPRHDDPVADWATAIAAATPVGKVNARSPAPITVGALGELKLPREANDDGRPYGAKAAADNLSFSSDRGAHTRIA